MQEKTEEKSARVMKGINLLRRNVEYVQMLATRESRSFSNMLDRVIERYRQNYEELAGR